MSKQTVYNILASKPVKVELGIRQDFEQSYQYAIDKEYAVYNEVVDMLGKVESMLPKLNSATSEFEKAYKMGQEIISSAKELGVDIDASTINKIEISKRKNNEVQQKISKLKSLLSQSYQVF
jgi:hypothetical protein